jgi:diguanylate cyclase (GGDEF)-like protein/PAS domain S-box-containing protein
LENALTLARQQNKAREQAEATLRESEEKYRLLFDNAGDAIFVHDKNGRIRAGNAVAVERLGYTREELMSLTVDRVDAPGESQHAPERIERLMQQGYHTFETVHQCKDGSLVPTEVNSRRIIWDGVPAVMSICRDATERKSMEENLGRLMREQQIILDDAPVGISLIVDKKQAWVNKKMEEMFQYPKEELEGKTTEMLYPSRENYEQLIKTAYPVLAQGQVYDAVHELVRRDGSHIWVRYNGKTIDPPDVTKGTIWMLEDITERKQTEEAVRLNETRYRQAIIGAGAVPYYRDYRPDVHVYTFMGEGILQLTGYSASEITPAIFDQLEQESVMRGPLAHLTPDEAGELSEAGKITHWPCDYRIQTRDGHMKWLADSAIQIRDENNRRIGVIGILQDITDRKLVEEAEREQRALAEALRDISVALNSTLEYHEVLNRILDNAGRVVPHDASNIMLLDPNDNMLTIMCHRGYLERGANDITNVRFPLSEFPLLAQVVTSGQPLAVADTYADSDWVVHPSTHWVRSFVTVPIQIHERTVGFLNLDNAKPSFFTSNHAERLRAFANHAAIAIENARLYEEIQKLALTDTMTGIYNRTFFELELKRMESSRDFPLSIVIADLDNLKITNDGFGHLAGDELIKNAVHILQSVFRAADVMARIGGDEFVMLLPKTDAVTARKMLSRIRKKMDAFNAAHPEAPILLSLGTSTAKQGELLTDKFTIADQHMYEDKARRKSKNE